MSHVKLIAETLVYVCHKNMKSMSIFFLQFFESFRGKIYKTFSTGNEERIEPETATMQSDYVLHNHLSISQAHLQIKQMHPEKTNNAFIFL